MRARERLAASTILPLTRRFDFPGKRRLRSRVPLPRAGVYETRLGGARFRLDLSESLQRDYYYGLADRLELAILRRLLAAGGDFVDVGAHVGLYGVSAARLLGGRGRVLLFEPNPVSRRRLTENLALNACDNVVVSAAAVSDKPGRAVLHAPRHGDASWSSLNEGLFAEDAPIAIDTTTLDAEVRRHELRPALVKIDVEGHESSVLAGASATLALEPALLIELSPSHSDEIIRSLRNLGYEVRRVGRRRLEPWSPQPGPCNALFLQPDQLALGEGR